MSAPHIEVIDRTFAAILAAKSPAERVTMADAAHRMARTIVQNQVEQLYPHWTKEQRQHEFLRRMLGHGADRYLASRR